MATESPIRIIEARGKWPPRNEMVAFGNLSGVEDLGLVLKGQRFNERKSTAAPYRSGSAPPSMEGSFAAIENLMFRHRLATNAGFAGPNEPEPEEQLRADPAYFAYYWAHVNLNPRLPPPLVSSENRHLMGTAGNNNRRLTSFDDSCDSSLRLDRSSLSTHKEESDDDRSPVNNQLENDVSISGITESQVAGIRNGVAAVNFSGTPKVEGQTHRTDQDQQQRTAFQVPVALGQSQTYVGSNPFHQSPTSFPSEVQPILQSSGFTPPLYATDPTYMMSANPVYPNMMPPGYFPQPYTVGGYGFNPTPVSPYATGYLPTMPTSPSFIGQSQSPGVNFQNFSKFYGPILPPFAEPFHEQKQQSLGTMTRFNVNPRRVDVTSPYYFEGPRSLDFVQFPNSPFASPAVPGSLIGGSGFSGPRNEMRQPTAGPKPYSFLEELKSGKGRRLELLDVYGHVVEFSADQHGSRFIQQKLEVCGPEEKESVFKEVLPHASRLITDVFGNYVIQKFFEYGSADQRRELGNQLEGQMLALSLQMYGCRVIQKALDVIDLEKKIQLVHELDGHVLRCVRDQNGNHVIQKCIESIPTDKIKFVISSFRGQVAALSTHPYGCRVIQRVLEHSTDELHFQFIIDEILESVYALAQDQYGNYVTQHVLERGRPEERNEIIRQLTGRIVQLCQHKFASNVIEKCLEYGDSPSREIMIEEIIGVDDGNDNLLAMVKDQFANYVVQKVLQTCTGDQREVLLGRIKDHLDSLKKYTYGKHIVARFEQLYGEEMQASGS